MLTESDRFILSSYLWQSEKKNLRIVMCYEEVNRISNDTIPDNAIDFSTAKVFTPSVDGSIIKIPIANTMSIYQNDIVAEKYKAIAIISINEIDLTGSKYFIAARNLLGLNRDDVLKDWSITFSKFNFN